MESDIREPLNIGSDQMVSINKMVDILEGIAGVQLLRDHDLTAPKGVRGRNSDNTKVNELLGWAPSISLEIGLKATYDWIQSQITQQVRSDN